MLNNSASVILTSTIASLRGFPGRSAYAASKVALRSYAGTWTMELKYRGIRVNTVTPGPCDTPLIDAQEKSPAAAAAGARKARGKYTSRSHGEAGRDCSGNTVPCLGG
jgi:NAD(P)-dependent dehydrogenase (short-subunit alcohol dehydrogenase family)